VTFGALGSAGYPDRPASSRLDLVEGARSLLVLGPDEEPGTWADAGGTVHVLRLRGGWTRKNPPNTVERSLVLLGSTADSERAGDVAAVVQRLGVPRVIGRGATGILAAYGVLLSGVDAEIVVVEPPVSHREGPHLLNVMRVWDIPDALGALAPRRLTLVGARDPAFERTAEIYRRAGAADRLVSR